MMTRFLLSAGAGLSLLVVVGSTFAFFVAVKTEQATAQSAWVFCVAVLFSLLSLGFGELIDEVRRTRGAVEDTETAIRQLIRAVREENASIPDDADEPEGGDS